MRKRFNADERAAIEAGFCEVKDGRTWYPARIGGAITVDCVGTQYAPLAYVVGKGTRDAYPGHVRARPGIWD